MGKAGSAMVKKRKGRVLIDSDTEDSGSEENLDQVRAGEARSEPLGPGISGPRSGLGSANPSPRSFAPRPGGLRAAVVLPQRDEGPPRGERALSSGGSPACPWQAARLGGFRAGGLARCSGPGARRRAAGRRGDAPGWLGPEEGRSEARPKAVVTPRGAGEEAQRAGVTFLCRFSPAGRAACQVPASRRPGEPLGAGGIPGVGLRGV